MSNHRKPRAVSRIVPGPTDGSEVNIDDPITVGPNKTITIDFNKVPAPARVYDADFAWIEHEVGEVRIFFAKGAKSPKGIKLRTRLEVRYPVETFVRHLWKNSREFHQRLREYVGKWPNRPSHRPEGIALMEAEKEHSEWVGIEALAHAGSEGVLDFYSMPPAGVVRFMKNQGSRHLKLIPVVRVQLSIFDLCDLLDDVDAVALEIQAYLPDNVTPEDDKDVLEGTVTALPEGGEEEQKK